MDRCPRCAREIDPAEEPQHVCAHAADLAAAAPPAPPDDTPEASRAPAEVAAQPNLPAARPGSSRWIVTAGLAASAGAALLTFAMIGGGGEPGPPAPEQASMLATPTPAPSRVVSGRPKWSSAGADRWVSDHRRSIAFELPAENTASSWMTSARPVLVVRCLAGTTQAFVYTQVPPAIELRDDRRTVRVSFDGAAEAIERWPGSADHDALFAPDGISFARRLASARTLRFGFTPHNGPPASIEFDVHGFETHRASLARTCRWKK